MYMFNMLKTNLNVFIRLFINNVEECIELVRNIKCELGKMQSRFSRLIKSKSIVQAILNATYLK